MLKNKRFVVSALVLMLSLLWPALASASTLNQAGVRLGRLGINSGSGGAGDGNDMLVTFKLKTTPTSVAKIDVVFPSGFAVATGTPATGTTFPNTPTSITAPPGLPGTATATAGTKDVMVSSLTSASLTSTTLYGFTIPAGTITNPGTAGQYNLTVCSENSSGTAGCASNVIDSTTVPVYIWGGAGGSTANADQVTVNASVAANFSFSLSANSDTVPTVDTTGSKTSTGVNMTVSTNSPLGYTAYVKSKNGALNSATSGGSIPTGTFDGSPDATTPAGTLTKYLFVPTSGSVCQTSCGAGAIAYDGEYSGLTAGGGGTTGGAFNSTNFSSFVSRPAYTGGDTFLLQERTAVTAAIPAANDYTDTLTIVAAGNY